MDHPDQTFGNHSTQNVQYFFVSHIEQFPKRDVARVQPRQPPTSKRTSESCGPAENLKKEFARASGEAGKPPSRPRHLWWPPSRVVGRLRQGRVARGQYRPRRWAVSRNKRSRRWGRRIGRWLLFRGRHAHLGRELGVRKATRSGRGRPSRGLDCTGCRAGRPTAGAAGAAMLSPSPSPCAEVGPSVQAQSRRARRRRPRGWV